MRRPAPDRPSAAAIGPVVSALATRAPARRLLRRSQPLVHQLGAGRREAREAVRRAFDQIGTPG